MESTSRPKNTTTALHHTRNKFKDPKAAECSPEHTKVWTEPFPRNKKTRRVPVVYYLSRNGSLEHPHFIEVPLSSSDGLYLRDVIDRLNSLRGKGMASSYSWSSKRSYKNGYVWHDLSDNDFIYPVHGQEYVLKGSELVVAGSKNSPSPELKDTGDGDFPLVKHRRNQSWSANDLHEYKVYSGVSLAGSAAADASTQTDDKLRRRIEIIKEEVENESSELSREEMSPPPSDSSPETLESVMKADGLIIVRSGTEDRKPKVNPTDGNKVKASNVLMQLITCGSISSRDSGFSLISHYKSRVPRGGGERNNVEDENGAVLRKDRRSKKHVVTEDKEYFSGSLIERKKEKFPPIKRSNSYTGNR